MGLTSCSHNAASPPNVCTKAQATHVHKMSKSAGILVFKRLKCSTTACKVFKMGACVDVGTDEFSSIYQEQITDVVTETTAWAALAVDKVGTTAGTCSTADQALADNAIRAF